MKKYLISIGAVATAVAPIAMVVSCDDKTPETPIAEKTNKDFANVIKEKQTEIKGYAENLLTKEIMTKETVKGVVLNVVGSSYDELKVNLTVGIGNSTTKLGTKTITLTVQGQTPIILDQVQTTLENVNEAKAATKKITKISLMKQYFKKGAKAEDVAPTIMVDSINETKNLKPIIKSFINISATGDSAKGEITVVIRTYTITSYIVKTIVLKGFTKIVKTNVISN